MRQAHLRGYRSIYIILGITESSAQLSFFVKRERITIARQPELQRLRIVHVDYHLIKSINNRLIYLITLCNSLHCSSMYNPKSTVSLFL